MELTKRVMQEKEGRKVEVYEAVMEWNSVENDTAVKSNAIFKLIR